MARPRLVSDDVILDATRQVLAELGPVKLTLAAVGAKVGLAPPSPPACPIAAAVGSADAASQQPRSSSPRSGMRRRSRPQ